MNILLGHLRRRTLGLSLVETSYTRRGFRGASPQMRERLEQIGSAFLGGYHCALESGEPDGIATPLMTLAPELRGFAYEGAGMGFTLLDQIFPWGGGRIGRFLRGAGEPHAYMVHVGAGWVWARLRWGAARVRRSLDPLLCWLAFDGWGFHEGFFHWQKYLHGQPIPRRLRGYERDAFDQGLGRSFWFVNGGNIQLIARTLESFPPARLGNLWSGIGLAAVYAGEADEEELTLLRKTADSFWPALAQGATFAAKARQRAGNPTEYTAMAVRTLTGLTVSEAANLTDSTLNELPSESPVPSYELWRRRIQQQLKTNISALQATLAVANALVT